MKTKQQATRNEMLQKMQDAYVKTTNPIWQAWSDSYMVRFARQHFVIPLTCRQHEWLVSHGIVRSQAQKNRDELAVSMNKYYYDVKVGLGRSCGEPFPYVLSA